ncbi:Protein of unknown function [Lactobacillus hominis DSM 23910 = CRBIP 24.179]|uniref:Uncharacterized protein n=1 Tax=Lactobacillus hominis DSM 23910 = CRBIP 24.179 TaxID=1423758 RepID=I7L5S6_9LACO|nr:Protein of unknown function [Lactobacillus hominis DSM 23910 = CRBIP 24.179]
MNLIEKIRQADIDWVALTVLSIICGMILGLIWLVVFVL